MFKKLFGFGKKKKEEIQEEPVEELEVEETEESREQTVTWEMRQLGIMDWITNDVDWMTKEVHPSSVRLAWHN